MRVQIFNKGLITSTVTLPNFSEAVLYTQRYNRICANKGYPFKAVIA